MVDDRLVAGITPSPRGGRCGAWPPPARGRRAGRSRRAAPAVLAQLIEDRDVRRSRSSRARPRKNRIEIRSFATICCVDSRSAVQPATCAQPADRLDYRRMPHGPLPAPVAEPDAARSSTCSRPSSDRVLWLATSHRPPRQQGPRDASGVKVGGHQASSASIVIDHDRAVFRAPARARPRLGQAARGAGAARDQLPARHARRAYLTSCAPFGGLQSYPSRAQGP